MSYPTHSGHKHYQQLRCTECDAATHVWKAIVEHEGRLLSIGLHVECPDCDEHRLYLADTIRPRDANVHVYGKDSYGRRYFIPSAVIVDLADSFCYL